MAIKWMINPRALSIITRLHWFSSCNISRELLLETRGNLLQFTQRTAEDEMQIQSCRNCDRVQEVIKNAKAQQLWLAIKIRYRTVKLCASQATQHDDSTKNHLLHAAQKAIAFFMILRPALTRNAAQIYLWHLFWVRRLFLMKNKQPSKRSEVRRHFLHVFSPASLEQTENRLNLLESQHDTANVITFLRAFRKWGVSRYIAISRVRASVGQLVWNPIQGTYSILRPTGGSKCVLCDSIHWCTFCTELAISARWSPLLIVGIPAAILDSA